MKHSRILTLALLLLAPCLRGQKAFESLLPEEPFMELRIRDTKGLIADLEESRIGQVVTDPSLRVIGDLLDKMPEWKKMMADLEEGDKSSKGMATRFGRMLLETPAEIRMAAGLKAVGKGFDGWMMTQISGDKEVLAEVVKSATDEFLDRDRKVVGKLEILGEERSFLEIGPGLALSFPFMSEGALYFLMSTDYERDFGKKRGQGVESLLESKRQRLAIAMNLGAIMPMIIEQVKSEAAGMPEDLFDAIGLQGMRSVGMSMDVKDDRIHMDLTMGVPEKGLIGDLVRAFVAREGRAAELLRWFPQGVQMADLWGVNLGEGYRVIMDFAVKVMDAQGMEGTDLEEMFAQRFGVGLSKGLIEPLDGRIMRFEDLDSDGMAKLEESELESSTQCLCLGLKDAALFGKTVDTIIRKMGWHVSRKKEVYRGIDLYYFKALGLFELHYGLTDQFFLLSFGAKPAGLIRKVVDQEKALAAGEKGFVAGKNLKDQLSQLPPNIAGLSVVDMVSMMTTLSDTFNQIMGMDGLDEEDAEDEPIIKILTLLGDKVPALLRKHEIRTAVTGFSRDKKAIRMLAIY